MFKNPLELPAGLQDRKFESTQWSVVIAAGIGGRRSYDALSQLCESYWYPAYAYVRRRVADRHEAQDLTQAFFSHLLEKQAIAKADPTRGRFRTFLLAALKNFLANEREKRQAEKRGGRVNLLSLDFAAGESRFQVEPTHELTPERMYERRWVLELLERTLDSLRSEWRAAGKERHFVQFQAALVGHADVDGYKEAAETLGVTPAAAKQAAFRLRRRYRELFRAEVAKTVADDREVDDEIGRLLACLGN